MRLVLTRRKSLPDGGVQHVHAGGLEHFQPATKGWGRSLSRRFHSRLLSALHAPTNVPNDELRDVGQQPDSNRQSRNWRSHLYRFLKQGGHPPHRRSFTPPIRSSCSRGVERQVGPDLINFPRNWNAHASTPQLCGRTARTLVRDGPLRVTLVALAPGGVLAEHQANGPITVHVLSGKIRFRVGEDEWMLEQGDLLSLGAAVTHAVDAEARSVFLLTVAASEQ